MYKQKDGFTLIELLIVIAIIGVLTAVLLPTLLGARNRANDVSADTIAQAIVKGLAALEIKLNQTSGCSNNPASAPVSSGTSFNTTNDIVVISTQANDPERVVVAAPRPAISIICYNTAAFYRVEVTYNSQGTTQVAEAQVNK